MLSGEEPKMAAEASTATDAPADAPSDEASTSVAAEEAQPPMTEEQRARMERLQEIERLRAKEKFITKPTGTELPACVHDM